MVRDARSRSYPSRSSYLAVPGELKFSTVNYNQNANLSSTFVLLNGLTRGSDAEGNRIGRNYTIRSIQWRLPVLNEANISLTCVPLRFLIVWDKDPNGALPALTDVLDAARTCAMVNMNNKARFDIVHSEYFHPSADSSGGAAVASANQVGFALEGYQKLKLRTTCNNGNAGTIADIQHGALYAVIFSEITAGTTDWDVNGYFRIRYEDV